MNLQHEPINDWCVLFQIRSGVNTPVPQDATAKGNTNYFEERKLTSALALFTKHSLQLRDPTQKDVA